MTDSQKACSMERQSAASHRIGLAIRLPSVSRTPYHSDTVMNIQPSRPANGQTSEAASHVDRCSKERCPSPAEEVCLDCYYSVIPKFCDKCFSRQHPKHVKHRTFLINAFCHIAQQTTGERNAATTPMPRSYPVSSTAVTRDNNMGTRTETTTVCKYTCCKAVLTPFCEGVATVMCIECTHRLALLLCHKCDHDIHTNERSGHIKVPLSHLKADLTQTVSPKELLVDNKTVLQNNTFHMCFDCKALAVSLCLDCEQKDYPKMCCTHAADHHRNSWSTCHNRIKLSDGTRIPIYICQWRWEERCKNVATLVCVDCRPLSGLLFCQTCDNNLHRLHLPHHRRRLIPQRAPEEKSLSSHRNSRQNDLFIRVQNEEDSSPATLSTHSVDAHTMTDAVDGTNFAIDTNSETEMEGESADEVESTYICNFKECKEKADVICLTCANKKPRLMVFYCSKCYVNKHDQQEHNSIQINEKVNEPGVQTGAEVAAIPSYKFTENVEKDMASGADDLTTPPVQQPEQTPQTSNIKRRASAASMNSLHIIHDRYAEVKKRVIDHGDKLKSAFVNAKVAKSTFWCKIGIAELNLIDLQNYQKLQVEHSKSKTTTLQKFENLCREEIKNNCQEKVSKAREDGTLIKLQTKAYD